MLITSVTTLQHVWAIVKKAHTFHVISGSNGPNSEGPLRAHSWF